MPTPAIYHDAYTFAVREYRALGLSARPSDEGIQRLNNLVVRYLARVYPRTPIYDRRSAASYGVSQAISDLSTREVGGALGTVGRAIEAGAGTVEQAAETVEHAGRRAAGGVEHAVVHAAEAVEDVAVGVARDVEHAAIRGAQLAESGISAALRALERAAAGTLAAILRAVNLPSAALPTRVPINSVAAFNTLSRTLSQGVPTRLAQAARSRAALRNISR